MAHTSINDSIVQIVREELASSTGAILHTGDISVTGTITAETINVKNLVTESGNPAEMGAWAGNTESDLNGKGFSWTWGNASTQLIYRKGNRLWTNAKLDVTSESNYNIDGTTVISLNSLGSTVRSSKLTSVGTLEQLSVSGDTLLGDFAFFNSTHNRLGLGTDEPSAAIDIVENNVNITIGSPATNLATIGTNSNHDVGIITDNISRIIVKNSGEVIIGDPVGKNGIVRINGSLYVDNLVSDTRLDRSSPLQFQATKDRSTYGLGISWIGTGDPKHLMLMSGPDRILSSESMDIADEKMYYINGRPVITSNGLGSGIHQSNLTSLGSLQSLTVIGDTRLHGNVDATNSVISAGTLAFTNGDQSVTISKDGIATSGTITISSQESLILSGDKDSIEIGSKTNNRKPVKVFGPLSVGINNPDPSLSFSVAGDVSIGNKRFTNSTSAPATGSYEIGDICWNSNPVASNYIGWVCVIAGNPGQWLPFGEIKSQ
jgi:hypothetical protein